MPELLSGLFFENIVRQYEYIKWLEQGKPGNKELAPDPWFGLFMELYETRMVKGFQLRVANWAYTETVSLASLAEMFYILPRGCKVVVHAGAENTGAELGRRLDETGAYARRGDGRTWGHWIIGTYNMALEVALALNKAGMLVDAPWVIAHPGYDTDLFDKSGTKLTANTLKLIDEGGRIGIENIPLLVQAEWYDDEDTAYWNQQSYLGVGGTPKRMRELLYLLGSNWKIVLDFAHMIVLWNQAMHTKKGNFGLYEWTDFSKIVNSYFALPHCDVCHYTGLDKGTLVDAHRGFSQAPEPAVIERLTAAFAEMRYICIEMPFVPENPDGVERELNTFCERFKL